MQKNLATLLFADFFKAFDSIHRGKMEQIILVSGLRKETVTAIMMFYKNLKAMVHLFNSDTDFFDTVMGVLQGDTLPVLQTRIDLIKENGFALNKTIRGYSRETMTNADYLVLVINTPAEDISQLHSLKQAAGGFGLYVNINKTEFMF